ncbi:MAG: Stk1 family PASTA domain-containing Ser/Thr kinase [Actinomycetota bacterium]|nr:Stk1 family PASTA domain-containing Ser/Thr kinase [Actinomycetota bacterium]
MTVDGVPEIVDQRYRIISRLGSGGMAEVYCAQDLQLGRKVALKLLHRRFAQDSDFVERFRREASAAAGLQHAHVVGVYDRGEWDDTYYIAMEYLEGRTLKEIITDHGPLTPLAAIDIAVQILKAARFAHRRGIVHRDIKPHNVILDEEGRAKVADFGIARAGASDMTETGSIMGTAQYLSPEQAQGHAVSASADLYAIGIVIYEMLAGRVPFEGESAVTIALKQVSEAPVPPSAYNPAVPPELDAIVLRALEKEPAHRFADADEFGAALETLAARLRSIPPGQSTSAFGAVGADAAALAAVGVPVEEAVVVEELEPVAVEEERRRRGAWAWVLAVLLVLGVLVLAFALTRPVQVKVPNVVGSQLVTGKAVLENAGFHVDVTRVTTDKQVDNILRQDPQPSSRTDKGATISLTVSNGPGQGLVPGVDKLARKPAQQKLQAAGFKVAVQEEASDRVKRGIATRTAPAAGQQVNKGSTVTLFVSSGPRQISVPNVAGQSQDAATATLANAGLKVSVTEQDSSRDAGTVLAQSPPAGTTVDLGTQVALTVARAPKQVSVPGVSGQDLAAARSALSGAGLRTSVSRQDVTDSSDDGNVISQDPASGSKVSRGSTVNVVVGRFRPATTPTTPTPPP